MIYLRGIIKWRISKLPKSLSLYFILLIITILLPSLLQFHACYAAEILPTKKVLILYSYSPDLPVQTLFTRGLQSQLQQDTARKVDYVYEYLEMGRYSSNKDYNELLSHFLKEKYAATPPDLIISHFVSAANFMIQYGEKTFPGVPAVLGFYEGEGEQHGNLPANYYDVIGTYGVDTAVNLILKTQPNTKKIYVVVGDSDRERTAVETFKKEVQEFTDSLEFIYLNKLPFEEMLTTLQGATDNSAILYLFLFKDAAGNSFIPGEALKRIHQIAPVPIYGSVSIFMGQGSIGGYMASQEVLGKKAGELGSQILKGRLPIYTADMKTAAAEYIFDWRELKRWGIAESSLPPGSKIEFREPTLWETYRWYICGALLLLLLETILVLGLFINRRKRTKAEATVHQLNDCLTRNLAELQNSNATLEEEIMERHAAQETLRDSQERYEAILKQSSEAVAVVDFKSKHIVEVNIAFSVMFDYSWEEVKGFTITDLNLLAPEEVAKMNKILIDTGSWTTKLQCYRSKGAQIIYTEMAASLINYRGKQLKLLSFRDITEQQKLQAEIQMQMNLAEDVQKSLLPQEYHDDNLTIRTIFQPLTMVSGDFYGFRLTGDKKRLHGYLLDVTGHGVAAGLHTAAINNMITGLMSREDPWTLTTLTQLNHHLMDYFKDNSLVALIAFTVDLSRRKLTCLSCGINYILASTQNTTGIIRIPGMYLGITETPQFNTVSLPIQHGDTFYFMTDGIYDNLPKAIIEKADTFEETIAAMKQLPPGGTNPDDRSAICLHISGLRSHPLFFDYSNPVERPRIYNRITRFLGEQTGDTHSKFGVAFSESLTNAVTSGTHIWIKVNRIGSRLIVRVRDDGNGFAGNAKISKLKEAGLEQVFLNLLEAEHGRGLPIMLFWTDKVLYNKKGNEVMLIQYLSNQAPAKNL